MRISNVIDRPVVTEKSMEEQSLGRYTFKVNRKASKGAVANEIKRIYGVEPVEVRTMIMPGKKRRVLGTRRFIKTRKWKKAIIKLKEGQSIDLIGK
jgi:large subunit ribosomal protein L23